MIGKFAFNDNAKAPHLKQHIGTVFAMNVDRLAVGGYAVTGNKNSELRVDSFFAVTVSDHTPLLSLLSCGLEIVIYETLNRGAKSACEAVPSARAFSASCLCCTVSFAGRAI